MATKAELQAKIEEQNAKISLINTLFAEYLNEVSALIGRFLVKLAAGVDTQPEIDQINSGTQTLLALEPQIRSAIDQAKLEGQ